MTVRIHLSKDNLSKVKTVLREFVPRPSDRTEALARALGYRTYAALRADMKAPKVVSKQFDERVFAAYAERIETKRSFWAAGKKPEERALERLLKNMFLAESRARLDEVVMRVMAPTMAIHQAMAPVTELARRIQKMTQPMSDVLRGVDEALRPMRECARQLQGNMHPIFEGVKRLDELSRVQTALLPRRRGDDW